MGGEGILIDGMGYVVVHFDIDSVCLIFASNLYSDVLMIMLLSRSIIMTQMDGDFEFDRMISMVFNTFSLLQLLTTNNEHYCFACTCGLLYSYSYFSHLI